jgi:hypothetical protein
MFLLAFKGRSTPFAHPGQEAVASGGGNAIAGARFKIRASTEKHKGIRRALGGKRAKKPQKLFALANAPKGVEK